MIYTVTLNPSLDYYISSEDFQAGKINRNISSSYAPGGKGINVSLMLKELGLESCALGISSGFSGREILKMLEEKGLHTDFCHFENGSTRINVKISDDTGRETDINGAGEAVSSKGLDEIIKKLSVLKDGDTLILAGSIPVSMESSAYEKLIAFLEEKSVRVVIDSTGEALLSTLKHKPFLIKPNNDELSEIFGTSIETPEKAAEYSEKLFSMGAQNVVVSMGSMGAVLVSKEGKYFCPTVDKCLLGNPKISSVGAGDSFVAGFVYAVENGEDILSALEWGVAAGAATAFSVGIASGKRVQEVRGFVESARAL